MKIHHLGQSGLRIDCGQATILVDPYLSNSVQELCSPELIRRVPIACNPEELRTVDWVLLTHEHIDHCDPHTIPKIAKASPQAIFVGPEPVREQLLEWNISNERIRSPQELLISPVPNVRACPVASAHPKIRFGRDGQPVAIGWIFEFSGNRLYVAGDTAICDELIQELSKWKPIKYALLPVNEDNYFRRRCGIIGNMSIREAFGLAEELGISNVIPVHWDMFEANSALPDEIKSVYKGYDWSFKLCMKVDELEL